MARIYQWNDPCAYRGQALLYESEDSQGTYCRCGFCHALINIDGADECPECHNHLVFPRAEW